MRIDKIEVIDTPPITNFRVSDLSDLVVIAGANGAGKSRLISQILDSIRARRSLNTRVIIDPTTEDEKIALGGGAVDTGNDNARTRLHTLLNQQKSRRDYRSGILYFESDRSISNVNPLKFSFEFKDPDKENISWTVPIQPLKNRWQDTQHAIFKRILGLRNTLGSKAMHDRQSGKDAMPLAFDDPLEPFKIAFTKLLSPKILVEPDLERQKLLYQEGEDQRSVETLSSGEREVVNIAFDFILRKPSDCVVFFDEPELHLHPELLNRLIKTMRSIGERNQFILVSHSPEVIASSLDDTLIFLTGAKPDKSNQATVLKPGAETTQALSALGQSVGVIALGKKVVLIEGTSSSLDTKVYSAIAQHRFPELVFLPSNSRSELENFDRLNENVLNRSLWGVQFFMLADRDAYVAHNEVSSTFKVLPRYHLENYFLDSEVLAECFEELEETGSWLLDPNEIEKRLHEFASSKISYAASLIAAHQLRVEAGNISLIPNNVHCMDREQLLAAVCDKASLEAERLMLVLEPEKVRSFFQESYDIIAEKLKSGDSWKNDIPAKPIFAQFCSVAKIQPGRLKNLYIRKAIDGNPDYFKDIVEIFGAFSER